MVSTTAISSGQRSSVSIARAVVTVLLLGTAAFSFFGFVSAHEGNFNYMIVALTCAYLAVECRIYLMRMDTFGLLAPPFLASLAHFFLAYLLPTSATIVDPWIHARFEPYFSSMSDQIGYALTLAGVSAFVMWRGYYFGLGTAARLRWLLVRNTSLRKEFEPQVAAAIAIQAGYFVLVSYAISIGVFGFASSVETRAANVELIDVINLGLAAGSLSFLLLMCHLFRSRQRGAASSALLAGCVAMVFLHLIVGAISGFKSQMVMPFVMITMAKFLVERRISFTFIAAGMFALIVAYQVIEPYREYLARSAMSGRSDTSSLVEALQSAYAQRDFGHTSEIPLGSQIAQRFDLTAMSAIGLAFFEKEHEAVIKGREMAQTLYLAPLLAYAPRVFWPDKPLFQTGNWFTQVVLGFTDNNTSVGMGPVAWLYLVGGLAGVLVGFFCIGWFQAIMFEGIARAGAGGFVVFLAAAGSLVIIPTDIGSTFVGLLRVLPIAFAAQWILLRAMPMNVR